TIEVIGIRGTRQLPDAVHAESRNTNVYGGHAQPRCCEWANGAATGHVIAADKELDRHLALSTGTLEDRAGFTVGRIALVCVDLDYRAAVEPGPVLRIM